MRGPTFYEIKVIEYQRLPNAHIVICYANRPTTPSGVDVAISPELPVEDGPLRRLVLQHMVHRCKPRCRPDGDTRHCKNGIPWAFQEETDFDRRGYP